MSNKPKLKSSRERMEERTESTKEAMRRYNALQLFVFFCAGVLIAPFLLVKRAFRR